MGMTPKEMRILEYQILGNTLDALSSVEFELLGHKHRLSSEIRSFHCQETEETYEKWLINLFCKTKDSFDWADVARRSLHRDVIEGRLEKGVEVSSGKSGIDLLSKEEIRSLKEAQANRVIDADRAREGVAPISFGAGDKFNEAKGNTPLKPACVPENDDMEKSITYQFEMIVALAVHVRKMKSKTYGDSWRKRGFVGVFMNIARKFDRVENIVKDAAVGWDLDPEELPVGEESLFESLFDLGVYAFMGCALLIVNGWCESIGYYKSKYGVEVDYYQEKYTK
jgi:hypothetical protein